jgi:hypothetical protein
MRRAVMFTSLDVSFWRETMETVANKTLNVQQKHMDATKEIAEVSLFLSHSSEDFVKAQQQILSATAETQSKIWGALNKYMGVLTTDDKSSQTAAADGSENGLFSVWQKSFQEAMEQVSQGRAMPPFASNSGNGSRGKKGGSHTRK